MGKSKRITKTELAEFKAAYLKHMAQLLQDEDDKVVGLPSLFSFAAEVGIDEETENMIAKDETIMMRGKKLRMHALISAMLTKRVDSTAAWHILDKSGYIETDEFSFVPDEDETPGAMTDSDRALMMNLAARLGVTDDELYE